ncbi:unnamed protein product, partial [Ectocarpus sp. 12 AP-2014]
VCLRNRVAPLPASRSRSLSHFHHEDGGQNDAQKGTRIYARRQYEGFGASIHSVLPYFLSHSIRSKVFPAYKGSKRLGRVVRLYSLLCQCSRGAESLTATYAFFRQRSLSPAAPFDSLEPPLSSLAGLVTPAADRRSPITETRSRCKPCTSPSRACTPAVSC